MDGEISHSTTNYQTGIQENYYSNQIERGETLRFKFHQNVTNQKSINKAATVGFIFSSEAHERFVELQGQLEIAKATLAANLVGEKQQVIQEYENRLAQAKAESAEKKEGIIELLNFIKRIFLLMKNLNVLKMKQHYQN